MKYLTALKMLSHIPITKIESQNPFLTFHQMCFGYLYNDWVLVLSGIFILSLLLLRNVESSVNKIIRTIYLSLASYFEYVRTFKINKPLVIEN